MAEFQDREHYIPLRKTDLVTMLSRDPKLSASERSAFQQFCKLISAVWHFEYHATLEDLKDAYAPFDPDADTKPLDKPSAEEKSKRETEVFKKLTHLMQKANFAQKSEDDVKKALEGTSEGGINMDVDLTVFEKDKWLLFARGDTKETKTVRRWYKLWMKETVDEEIWKRLVMVFKLQKHKRLTKSIDYEKIYVRVYKDIPKMDLEMLIPGATPQMTRFDKLNILIPLLTGLGTLLFKVLFFFAVVILAWSFLGELKDDDKKSLPRDFDEVPAQTKAWYYFTSGAFLVLLMGLGGYAFKSYSGYLNTRNKYEKSVNQSLFYQTLDGNAGVLFRLLDEAEEQEFRETILAYFYLWKYAPPEGWTQQQLDDYIENELEAKLNMKIDFEVDDAIGKLETLGIVTKQGDHFKAVPMDKALALLNDRWDKYFTYQQA